jgi:cathepsin A (carboxypeptidase C)
MFNLVVILTVVQAGSSKLDAGPFIGETWYSGLIDIEDSSGDNDDIFYWLFEPRNKTVDAPLILWLSGGPGCSSEFALFMENGPF